MIDPPSCIRFFACSAQNQDPGQVLAKARVMVDGDELTHHIDVQQLPDLLSGVFRGDEIFDDSSSSHEARRRSVSARARHTMR